MKKTIFTFLMSLLLILSITFISACSDDDGITDPTDNNGSSAESVGEVRLRQITKCVI